MADDVSAGRLVVDVVGDASEFSRGLQAKIDKEVANVKARIRAEIDDRQVERQAQAARRTAERAAGRLNMVVNVDSAGVTDKVRAARDAAERNVRAVRLRLDVDTTGVAERVRTARNGIEARLAAIKVRVQADLDTTRLRSQLQALSGERHQVSVEAVLDRNRLDSSLAAAKAAAQRERWNINLGFNMPNINLGGVGQLAAAAGGLAKIALIAEGISLGVVAASQLAAGLTAVVGVAGQAVNTLAALPGAISAGVAVVGTMLAGFRGVGDAVKALGKAQAAQGAEADAIARQQEAAQRRIGDAQRAVADAQRNAARQAEASGRRLVAAQQAIASAVEQQQRAAENGTDRLADAQRRIADAQERVVDAQRRVGDAVAQASSRVVAAEQRVQSSQRDSLRAQQALTQARKDAKEALEDLALSLKAAALDEEAAGLAVERAREALDKANRDPRSTDLDRREADLSYRQALQRLEEVKEANEDLRTSAKDQQKAGVEGSNAVRNAQERIVDAARAQRDAEADLVQTRKDGARAVSDAQRGLLDAQEAVTEAVRDQARAARDVALANRDAARAVAESRQGYADAQRDARQQAEDSARSVANAQRNLAEAQVDANRALERTSSTANALNEAMENLSPAGQRFARFLDSTLNPALGRVRRAAQEAMLPGVQEGMESALALEPVLTRIVTRIGGTLGGLFRQIGEGLASEGGQANLQAIGDTADRILTKLTPGIMAFGRIIGNLSVAAGPFLERVATALSNMLGRLDKFVGVQKRLGEADPDKGIAGMLNRAYEAAALLLRVGGHLVELFGSIFAAAAPAGTAILEAFDAAVVGQTNANKGVGKDKLVGYFNDMIEPMKAWGRLIGSVFDELVDLSRNPETTRLLDRLATEIVPKLGDAIRVMSEGGAFDAFIDLVGNLLDLLVNLGGPDGALTAFLDALSLVVGVLEDIAGVEGVSEVVGVIGALAGFAGGLALTATALGKIAKPLLAISKMTGLNKVIGAVGRATGIVSSSGKGPKVKPKGKATSTRVASQTPAQRRRATAAAVGGRVMRRVRSSGGDAGFIAVGREAKTPVKPAGAATSRKVTQTATARPRRLPRAGGAVGVVGAVAGSAVGGAVSNGKGGVRDALGGALSGAASGAGLGAMVGSVIPGIGTAIGAAIGGALGAIAGAVNAVGFDKIKDKAGEAGGAIKRSLGGVLDDFKTEWNDDVEVMKRRWREFQDGLSARWQGVKESAADARDSVVSRFNETRTSVATRMAELRNDAGSRMGEARTRVATAAANLRNDVGDRLSEARTRGATWMAHLRNDAGARMSEARTTVATRAAELRNDLGSRFSEARDRVNSRMGELRDGANSRLTQAREWLNTRAGEARNNVVTRFQEMRDRSNTRVGEARNWVNDRMGELRDRASARAGEARDRIGTAWSGVQAKMAGPVEWVVRKVFNGGLIKAWNAVATKVSQSLRIPNISLDLGGSAPATPRSTSTRGGAQEFARGGVAGLRHRLVPGYAPGRDRVNSLLAPGEGVLVPEAVRGIARGMGTTARNAIDAINGTFSRRVSSPLARFSRGGVAGEPQRFALGGVADFLSGKVDAAKRKAASIAGMAKEGVSNVAGGVKDIVVGGLRKAFDRLLAPVHSLAASQRKSGIGTLAANTATGLFKPLGDFLTGKDREAATLTGGTFTRGGGKYPPAQYWVKSANTAAAEAFSKMTWGVPTGTLGVRPNRSDHPMGKALDLMVPNWGSGAGKMLGNKMAQWFVSNAQAFGTKYVIWNRMQNNGSGWRGYQHPLGRTDPTSMHEDHVHVSFLGEGGTVLPRQGGTLAVLAEQGRAETVVDTGSMNALIERILAGDVPGARNDGRNIVFEQGAIQVFNPEPEPASESVNTRMRRLAVMGLEG